MQKIKVKPEAYDTAKFMSHCNCLCSFSKDQSWTEQTRGLTTVFFILSLSTVVLSVATEDARDTATGVRAFELTGQAHVDVWRH